MSLQDVCRGALGPQAALVMLMTQPLWGPGGQSPITDLSSPGAQSCYFLSPSSFHPSASWPMILALVLCSRCHSPVAPSTCHLQHSHSDPPQISLRPWASLSCLKSSVTPVRGRTKCKPLASSTQPWPLLPHQPHLPLHKPQHLTRLCLPPVLLCSGPACFTRGMPSPGLVLRGQHTPPSIQLQCHLARHLSKFPSLELRKDPVQAFILTPNKTVTLFSMLS